MIMLLTSVGGMPVAFGDSPGQGRLLVFGDSLSTAYGIPLKDSWVTLLQERLDQRFRTGDHVGAWKVHNASISGETTAGGRTRLPGLLQTVQPQLVILELGGNDGLRGLSLRAMRDNLEAMLDAIAQQGSTALLVGIRITPNYGPVYTERFVAVFADLAAQRELAFVPFLLEGVALQDGMMQDDGIHPSAAAQPRILDNVWSELEPLLRRLEALETMGVLRAPHSVVAACCAVNP